MHRVHDTILTPYIQIFTMLGIIDFHDGFENWRCLQFLAPDSANQNKLSMGDATVEKIHLEIKYAEE